MMVLVFSLPSVRRAGGALLAWGAAVVPSAGLAAAEDRIAIRPFRVDVPESDLADLRRRLMATRWPDKETVTDRSQGEQLARLQELVRYWGTDYDWRKAGGDG